MDFPDGPIKFSIIMSLWEPWDEIRKAMACVKLQTYENWELIIVSDGPAPETARRIIRKVGEQCGRRRVQLIQAERVEGIWGNQARALGLDACTGDYVCWVNHDNIIFPDFLHRHFTNITTKLSEDCGTGKLEREPLSLVNLDYWLVTRSGNHKYIGVLPDHPPRLGGFDLMNLALPLDLAREIGAFGPAMEAIHHADWLIFDAAHKLAPVVSVSAGGPIDGIHF